MSVFSFHQGRAYFLATFKDSHRVPLIQAPIKNYFYNFYQLD